MFEIDRKKVSVLLNSIEQSAAETEDKGEETFTIRLSLEDARILTRLRLPNIGCWFEISKEMGLYKCSNCGNITTQGKFKYCYNCGAKMGGEQDEID